jgi:excinuclease ABC subunit B
MSVPNSNDLSYSGISYGDAWAQSAEFELSSHFQPSPDQQQAIDKLIDGLQTEKTQLYQEFRNFFPENAVEYFVSYYDYYQPEAYIASTDTFIEKEALINDEIDRLRHSATRSLFERRDCIVVASVSCIYGLGSPEAYYGMLLMLSKGEQIKRREILHRLVEIQYQRDDFELRRGTFRVRGDVIEVIPAWGDYGIRIEMFGDKIDAISQFDPLTGEVVKDHQRVPIYPKSHYVMPRDRWEKAVASIREELEEHCLKLEKAGQLLEAQRVHQRTMFDLEMIRTVGYCRGVENYSRHLTGRHPGQPPPTLMDYLPPDAIVFVDESHAMVPQLRGMYEGDRSRKLNLVKYGFRLPSALDNRPLSFAEIQERMPQTIYVSATPGSYELTRSAGEVVEQIIRPTGLMDPEIEVSPVGGQIDDLLEEIRKRAQLNERVLVTTLTKRMAEELSEYYTELGVAVCYLHSEIDTLDRVKILRDLRLGKFDVLVGVNLLREGLDLPEVSLVAILDADKEGFLRSTTSLIQTAGRAARNVNSKVIMYADTVTRSMAKAIEETGRRRELQKEYNRKNSITPQTILKPINASLLEMTQLDYYEVPMVAEEIEQYSSAEEIGKEIERLTTEMKGAAKRLEFEKAATFRDQLKRLKEIDLQIGFSGHPTPDFPDTPTD